MTQKIVDVVVRKVRGGCLYICRAEPHGWRCGRCMRGILRPLPKRRDRCRVCDSLVAEIRYQRPKARPVTVVFPNGEFLVYR